MNLLDALTTLVDAARQLPETRHLKAALKRVEQRIEVQRDRANRRLRRASDPERGERKRICSRIWASAPMPVVFHMATEIWGKQSRWEYDASLDELRSFLKAVKARQSSAKN